MKILKTIAPVVTGVAAALVVSVLPASASVHHPQLSGMAVTQLSDRLDSGDHGYWATDTIQRDLTITSTGGDTYTATVTDEGSFVTIPGNLTPGPAAPVALTSSVKVGSSTTIAGTATYSFTADQAPDLSLVPASESGTPVSGPQTTSLWFEQAFPAGTVFTGGITDWSWVYHLKCPMQIAAQVWTDSLTVDSGNILGC
jgi:hypothetical protein